MASILIVEDEEVLAKNITRALSKLGHGVVVAESGAAGRQVFAEQQPDLTLLDLRLPDASGLDLLAEFRAQRPESTILMMTGHATVEDAVRAIKLGARDYLQKPLNMEELRLTVTRALEEAQLQVEVSYYRGREARGAGIEALLGECPAMAEVRAKIRRLCDLPRAAAPPPVLITGETGTGKGLVARALHYNGPRADRPFIEVNCAAIPENLVEAELFGHERGAFTDAKTNRIGLFQAAHQGALFLDEIGCLPLTVQSKILKAIEERSIRPLGARAEKQVDIQIIAATNSPLERMVEQGTFREDLYYRLRVVVLGNPPLRERGEDALLLVHNFLGQLCETYRLPRKTLTPAAEQAVLRYRWPGNVRELRNTLDRAVLFSEGTAIDADALGLPAASPPSPRLNLDEDGLGVEIPDSGISFEEIERTVLLAALRKSEGSPTRAARLLGMTRDTFRYRMEKFGIEIEGKGGV